MKYLVIVLVSIFLSVFNFSAQAQSNDKADKKVKSQRDQMEIQVDGLGCPFCAYGLEKEFKDFKGIKDVNIEMETGVFTFSYPTEKALNLEQIKNKVDEAGYTAVTTKITRADGTIETSGINETELSDASEIEESSFFVAGNCGMCKARIENAASTIAGVTEAEWNKETKQLSVRFDKSQTSKADIELAIATSGHDTQNAKAEEETYNNLPGCCQYER